jgi:hypothetical protein
MTLALTTVSVKASCPLTGRCELRADLVEQVAGDLEAELGEIVDRQTLRFVVNARAQRFDDAPVQDFVPLFVEREMRAALKRRA